MLATRNCVLLLGGNMGDRQARLEAALKELNRLPGGKVLVRSNIYETAPVGQSRRPYLNMAVRYRTLLTPMGLLIECKRIEAASGRRPGPRWGPRPVDVDILDYAGLRLRTPWLVLPHPLVATRPFALAPLRDIAADWKPDGKATVRAHLRRLKPGPGIVRIFRDG